MVAVELVVAALVAGLASGAGDVATSALRDAYAGLRQLIVRRFGGDEKAQETLRRFEDDPATYQEPLAEELGATGATTDEEVLAAARKVLDQAQAAGVATKYSVRVSDGGKVGIVGDDAHVGTQNF
ncbi:hypothetical protein [Cellulomonas sp. S1-8]|uniref:hypothetical protein n=1 Tax=Cellulomonas sp. S1-8 TaxID=2904790 RepID=UPI002243BAF9|nr:hypothetical protein [Cellulomonas sp. S1-8]UZN02835.1 hypothetical protein OKX07_17550 [Cellulomonas sp. S1-8]